MRSLDNTLKNPYSLERANEIEKLVTKWYAEFINDISSEILNEEVGKKVYFILKGKLNSLQFQKIDDGSKYKYENIIVKTFNIIHDSNMAFGELFDKLDVKNYNSKSLIKEILSGDFASEWGYDMRDNIYEPHRTQYTPFIDNASLKRAIHDRVFKVVEPYLKNILLKVAIEVIIPKNIDKLKKLIPFN